MSQLAFDRIFDGRGFGPRGGFVSRDWQIECKDAFLNSAEEHASSHEGNGTPGQLCFCIYAGTGSGKTKALGSIACHLLNAKLIRQIVFVCPNRSIVRKTIRDFRQCFDIHLVPFHAGKHAEGVPLTKQGYILTYAHLIQNPGLHRDITRPETLVVFDEVHHLGHNNSAWGEAALSTFGHVPYVVTLTGTPWRPDNSRIPFVTYESTAVDGIHRFRADHPFGFTYRLGRAVAEGVCRKPIFLFRKATETVVKIRPADGSREFRVSFADKVGDLVSSLRLGGAVQAGSVPRREMLRDALDICRAEGRKVAIFVGGDTSGDPPTIDATQLLPQELEEIGIGPDEIEILTGDDKEAQAKIEAFGASKKWILISINMVSEGTDIPELSAAIFLTSVTSKLTTIQRIGRVLRLMGATDPHKTALLFMLPDPTYLALGVETEAEIEAEELRLKKKREDSPGGGEGDRPRDRAEAIGIEDGGFGSVMFNGVEYPFDVWKAKEAVLRSRRLPFHSFAVGLSLALEDRSGNG